MRRPQATAASAAKVRRQRRAWVGLALAGAWLAGPIVRAQHLEGYTANLKSIALMANRGQLERQDLLTPAITEFIYFTRAGVIGLLRGGELLLGPRTEWDFRGLMILSLAAILAGSVFVARRVDGVRPLAALAALLVIPGVTENALFFNDNLPSAAFAIGGLALSAAFDRKWALFCAGMLLAMAVLCRLDAVLLAPAIGGMAWLRHSAWRPVLKYLVATALGLLLGLVIGALVTGATPLDAILASRGFGPNLSLTTPLLVFALFIGTGGALLLALGAWVAWRRWTGLPNRWRRVAVLMLYPAAMLAVALILANELRYIHPLLTPFLALYGGNGVQAMAAGLKGRHRRAALAGIAAVVLPMLVPPVLVVVRDGPRSPTGRLWMPILWWQWEDAMSGSIERIDATVEQAERTKLTVLVSTHFNDDFFLKQRLLVSGWQIQPAPVVFPGCSGFVVYEKNGHTVAHVRTEREYGRLLAPKSEIRALLIDRSLACAPLRAADRSFLTTWGDDSRQFFPTDSLDPALLGPLINRFAPVAALSARLTPADARRLPPWSALPATNEVWRRQLQGTYRQIMLSRAEVDFLAIKAANLLHSPSTGVQGGAPLTWAQFVNAYQRTCGDPQASNWRLIPLCVTGPGARQLRYTRPRSTAADIAVGV